MFFITVLTSSSSAQNEPVTDVFNGGRGSTFNDNWKFFRGDASGAYNVGFNDASWRKLSVPHDWSIELPFNQSSPGWGGGGYLDGGIGWYRKSFLLPISNSGKRITIQFEGIYMNSSVWINGHLLGTRPYGYSTFEYDLTPYVYTGTITNVIAVKVDNTQPNSRWYSGSGIYRNVWLTVTYPVHVAYCGSVVTTSNISQSSANVAVTTKIQNHSFADKKISVITSVYDQEWKLLATNVSVQIILTKDSTYNYSYNYTVNNPKLWSMAIPYLYNLKTQIVDNSRLLDCFSTTFGIRSVTLNPNTGFWLNNENIKLRGVCMHHDLGSLGAAQNYRALERQVEILKSFGCNAIRTSHNFPAPELLEICDKLGLVVMDEAFDCWETGKNTNDYGKYFDTWAQQDVQDWVRRDRNHPSVVMWSIGNEIPQQGEPKGYTIAQNLIKWVKADDKSRPITQALNYQGLLGPLLDMVGYNYGWGSSYDNDHRNNPNWVIFGSETSSAVRTRGVYHLPTSQNILTATDMQCSSYDNSVVSWGHSAEDSWEIDKTRSFVAGQFIWTGFDYIGEPTPYGWPAKSSYFGIVDMCGFPKDIYYFYQSQWTVKPMVHLLPHWNWSPGDTIPVWAYSNCDSVSLTLNGARLGAKRMNVAKPYHAEWKIPFVAGKVKAKAFRNGVVAAQDSIITAGTSIKINLKADRNIIQANGKDQTFIETSVFDVNGTLAPNAENQISYSIAGPGKIVGVDNGNPLSLESFKGAIRKVFSGKCLAIVQSTGAEGQITVTASTPSVLNNLALQKPAHADSEDIYAFTNIALKKTATSDTQQSDNLASSGNDGNISSRWCATDGNAGHWWKVDLGANKNIKGTEIVWERDNAYQYKIETSTNNSIWKSVVNKTSNTTSAQIMDDTFTDLSRYVRITVTGGVGNSWASFFEFRVFDGTTSVSTQRNIASKANDGSPNTYWSAADGNTGHSWAVDLGSALNITKTQVMWLTSGIAYKYKIETSVDSSAWNLTVDQTNNFGTQQIQTDSFKVAARYVRITITGGTSTSYKAGFYEFRVFDGSKTAITSGTAIINCVKPVCMSCLTDSATTKPWINLNGSGWKQTNSASLTSGGNVSFSTLPTDTTVWKWSGPNGFSATAPQISIAGVQQINAGTYTATHNNVSVDFVLDFATGIFAKDLPNQDKAVIFPNPSNNGFFTFENCKSKSVSVCDTGGKVVFNSLIESESQPIDLSALPNGIFIAKLSSENKADYKKIVITRK
jgi:beta-galactosidase